MNEIITVPLKDKTIEGLAKKIEDYQNTSGLISKGTLAFSNLPNNNLGVIMFFPKPINTQLSQEVANLGGKLVKQSPTLQTQDSVQGEEGQSNKQLNTDEGKHGQGTHKPRLTSSGDFIPTEDVLTRWAGMRPSSRQIFALEKMGCKIKPKTMLEAYELREELKNKSDFFSDGSYK